MNRITIISFALLLFSVASGVRAAPYTKLVSGDMGGLFPANKATMADVGRFLVCANGGDTVCPPGQDNFGFPFDTINAGDIAGFVDAARLGVWYTNPANGFVNFAPDAGNPAGGSGYYGVIVTNVTTAANLSGLHNFRGELEIRAEILADATGGAWLGATVLPISGPNVTVSGGFWADGYAETELICGPMGGDVTIRYFTQSYYIDAAAGEVCAGGASCVPGEHLDQMDLIVSCP